MESSWWEGLYYYYSLEKLEGKKKGLKALGEDTTNVLITTILLYSPIHSISNYFILTILNIFFQNISSSKTTRVSPSTTNFISHY